MKRDKIIYWVSTSLVSGAMLMSAFMYLSRNPELMNSFRELHFPEYFVLMLGVAKLLGALALLIPVWRWLKEWSYAGFTFVFAGAIWSHLATDTPWVAPLIFLLLLILSYLFWTKTRVNS